jgi:hypothetical protein
MASIVAVESKVLYEVKSGGAPTGDRRVDAPGRGRATPAAAGPARVRALGGVGCVVLRRCEAA